MLGVSRIEIDLYVIAFTDRELPVALAKFGQRNMAFRFIADINRDKFRSDVHHPATDDLARLHRAHAFFKHLTEVFPNTLARLGRCRGCGLAAGGRCLCGLTLVCCLTVSVNVLCLGLVLCSDLAVRWRRFFSVMLFVMFHVMVYPLRSSRTSPLHTLLVASLQELRTRLFLFAFNTCMGMD